MKSLLILLVLVSGFYFSGAFAQESFLSIHTNDRHYEEGDTIVISGQIPIVSISKVTIQLFTEGNLVDIAQIIVAQDGTYSHTVLAEGPLWKHQGQYIARASYGEHIAETEFSYVPRSDAIVKTEIFDVNAGSKGTFDVEYSIKGGTVKDIIVNSNNFALEILIDTSDDGSITLDMPREFIGAEKQDGKDEMFIILIDGIQVAYQESIKLSDSRVITINFEQDDSKIEIIGTTFDDTLTGYQGNVGNSPISLEETLEKQRKGIEDETMSEKETGCGMGTVYDPETEWCIIIDEPVPTVKPIPQWVKGIFAFYANGQINDTELLDAIKFLIEQKILVVN